MRSEQVEQDPASAAWVTGVIWDEQEQVAVGRAGYHGPPNDSGMVEIGYAVDPAYRRRGYARAALEALLQRAAHEPQVKVVRVTISPDNTASYALASQYGFANMLMISGGYAGPAVGAIVFGWASLHFGWRAGFLILGAAGFFWILAALLWFRRPADAQIENTTAAGEADAAGRHDHELVDRH